MTKLSIDLETASDVDLFKFGLDNYSRNARILMCAYAYDDEPVKLWQAHEGQMPADLREGLRDPTILKHAFNAQFERVMLSRCLSIDVPINQWRDTMVQALYLSLPGKLSEAGPIVGIDEDKQKLSDGKRLIRKFCQPRRPTKDKPWAWADWTTDPEDWELFGRYCKNDVEAERAIAKKLAAFPVPDSEWELWFLDQEINDRGMPVDMQLVDNAIGMVELEKRRLVRQLKTLTGLRNPMSTAQFQEWATARGYPFGNVRKTSIQRALNDHSLEPQLRRALEIRSWANKKSVEKFQVIKNMTGPDNRLRYQFQFYGAQRTGRWSGRGSQPQNLARSLKHVEKKLNEATEMIRAGDYDGLGLEFGNPMGVLSSCIRSAFRAPEGRKFVVADLNAIENRGTAWVARCDKTLDEFKRGLDPYLAFAVYLYGESYEDLLHEYKVLGKGEKRTGAKPGKLGCFAADTPVLTDRGWVPIDCVRVTDLVHDGIEFCRHDGVAHQGMQKTIDIGGVRCTPDHLILTTQGWKDAESTALETSSMRSALALASGLLKDSFGSAALPEKRVTTTGVVAPRVTECLMFREATWIWEKHLLAAPAQIARFTKNSGAYGEILSESLPSSTGFAIGSTRFGLAAIRLVKGTIGMPDAALSVGSPTLNLSSNMFCLCRAMTILDWTLTESTTAVTTKQETCVSLLGASTTQTRIASITLSMLAVSSQPPSFTLVLRRDTETPERSPESFVKVRLQRKSLPAKSVAEEPTFDVLNAGPRNRFVILTSNGPIIVHNCQYRLSGGELVQDKFGDLVKTGLWGYAEALGVNLSQQDAHRAVAVFREAYPKIVRLWFDLEEAMRETIITRRPRSVGPVKFDIKPPCLRIELPNGRHLHYIRPKIETKTFKGREGPYERQVITYEGVDQKTKKWGRVATHGGRATENIVQAFSRDVLAHGMLLAMRKGFEIVGTVHDEIIAEVSDPSLTVELLEKCMAYVPKWAPGLPLAAAGYEGPFYKKG